MKKEQDYLEVSKTLSKGQIISKWFFGVFDFLQKTNENKSIWGIIVVKSNSFVRFLEEIEDIKTPFEINWPLGKKAPRVDTYLRSSVALETLFNFENQNVS